MRFAQARLVHQLGAMDLLMERAALRRGRRTDQLLQKDGGASRVVTGAPCRGRGVFGCYALVAPTARTVVCLGSPLRIW
jgi:hypothetical protein